MKEAILYLFPTPIADNDLKYSIPAINLELLEKCDCFIVENLRTARRFLKKAGYKRDLNKVDFFVLNKHTDLKDIGSFLDPIRDNRNIGLMSEAGLPCVADPGSMVVSMAQNRGIKIKPLVGASSLMMALMASGFNGQNFAFLGYLPIEKAMRSKRIKELESIVEKYDQTQIFIEAPYRNNQMLESLTTNLKQNTLICIGVDISMDTEEIITKTANNWKRTNIDLHKRNTVFLIYK